MIPKKIHYCWFGGKKLPAFAQRCIASWKKVLPDYEIIQWNESNFDVQQNEYIKEAYSIRKWAFVSDFARMKILYENGGLYFDTDVELLKPLGALIEQGGYLGCERNGGPNDGGIWVNPGVGMAAEAGNPVFKEVLDGYRDAHYINPDGSFNTVAIIKRTTQALKKFGLQDKEGIQVVEGLTILPKDYCCPIDYITNKMHRTENTVSIHHYSETWVSPYRRIRRRITCFLGEGVMKHLRAWKRKWNNLFSH